ncbi:MAG: hypothetical protein RIN56_13100 [Sporomusaceae bacterium]|nr:hypothetical protein [Sporomusaceae bacterium]
MKDDSTDRKFVDLDSVKTDILYECADRELGRPVLEIVIDTKKRKIVDYSLIDLRERV